MYSAKVLENLETSPGCWNHQKIGVFRDGEQIGEYTRNYSAFYQTFYPFSLKGKDYALYSPHYTATRLMEFPSCRDIGGEDPSRSGFCPVEFYVPLIRRRIVADLQYEFFANCEFDNEFDFDGLCEEKIVKEESLHLPFGFASGCVWGDDSSWKIELFDLKNADQGKIQRTNFLGYKEIPPWLKDFGLKKAIHFLDFQSDFLNEEQVKNADLAKDLGIVRFELAIKDPDYFDWNCQSGEGKSYLSHLAYSRKE